MVSDLVKVVVGDIVNLTKYVGDQFNLRPVFGTPPLGQVVQVEQGVQNQGVGVAAMPYGPPVHHHTLHEMNGDRAQSYAGNMSSAKNGREGVYVNHQSHFVDPSVNHNHNKNLVMPVIEEREREVGRNACPPLTSTSA